MPVKELKRSELLAEIASFSDPTDGVSSEKVDAAFLRRLTQKQLQDLAKRLAVPGYSRMNKDVLASRLWIEVEPMLEPTFEPTLEPLTALDGASSLAKPKDGASVASMHHPRATDGAFDGIARAAAPGVPADDPAPGVALDGEPPHSREGGLGDGGPRARDGVPGREIPVTHRFDPVSTAAALGNVREGSLLPTEIPWGYGHDRVTAMPVDPERLFVYWEVLEESISKARRQLGAAGTNAWLNLRLYDTTGRIFDGTNAHGFRDQGVDRNARQWFFDIGRPTSELIAEIGMLSAEGHFAKIARSGRVEFPRREPVAWSDPEWMTVRASTGHIERSNPMSQVKSTGSAVPGAQPPPGHDGWPGWFLKIVEWQDVARFALGGGAAAAALLDGFDLVGLEGGTEQHLEWEEIQADGTTAFHRRTSWESPTLISSWETGPFLHPVEVPAPVREVSVGKTHLFKVGDRTHAVYGPWQVVIRGLGAHRSRAVLARWEMFRSWQTTSQHKVRSFVSGSGSGASERMLRGASEMAHAGGSAMRLGGASELFYLGASELRLGGASESLFAASSHNLMRGASERHFGGASELRLSGGSEMRLSAASEARLADAGSPRAYPPAPFPFPQAAATLPTSPDQP